ncbi:MAG TPA: leucyl/phenylalanyl-tRNA--protein transferase [Pyrinomonadaceae bacterium]|nr:leucyl/phenylalanyl-tRNA--protein transferase [Pyrinomonadaceae bacterium]
MPNNFTVSSINFPNPRFHEYSEWVLFGDYYYNARDIVGFGGELSIENLRNAYHRGIFPWHIDNLPLPWFCPEHRAVLEFSELHIPRTLRKERQKTNFTFTIDKSFRQVIENCAKTTRNGESGTWITADFIRSFCKFHEAGDAHSVEVWDDTSELVGGLYGVDAEGIFCGESMFFARPNASKLALLFLIEHLKTRGATWLDTQVMTPHFEVFGAKEIARAEFLNKLEETQAQNLKLFEKL